MPCCQLCHLFISIFSCRRPGGGWNVSLTAFPWGPSTPRRVQGPLGLLVSYHDRPPNAVLFLERGPRCLSLTPELLRQTSEDHRQGRPPCLSKSQSSVLGCPGLLNTQTTSSLCRERSLIHAGISEHAPAAAPALPGDPCGTPGDEQVLTFRTPHPALWHGTG